ncbi:MAG: GNAT family N-acetyltransferase [Microbacteriaceae bacterium]
MSGAGDVTAEVAATPEVRAIRSTDKAQWARLFVAYGIFYETAFTQEIVDALFEKLTDETAEIQSLVAVRGDAVIGFAHFRRLYDTFRAGPGWFLDDLYVTPEARGSGAATALIETLRELANANGGGTVRWITAHDNHTAQSVYDKLAQRQSWVTYEMET